MNTEEPTAIGTVVRDGQGALWVRSESGTPGADVWLDDNATAWQTAWGEILDPTIVHQGYTPPTPEPTAWGAVVRDANGHRFRRGSTFWTSPDIASFARPWEYLCQPVEVLFEGVEE